MAYKALYRTYRPTRFDEVVGQKHIIQVLKNAVAEERISHAYVFSGLRGIGKTTIARIFAKAVNCEHPINGEPCNECDNCKSVIKDETTDVIELDAASNNGVEQMREILEMVNFLPSSLKKKVYIIDEAHMLSTAAFNALLKTLEEPPAHVIFILATTEPYKIPSTILSRCQRLDFKQLSIDEILEMLTNVALKENIKITDEALIAIAEASEGGMRDALSILDQARVYNFAEISIEDINNITGRVSHNNLTELIRALNFKNLEDALDKVNSLIESGKEVNRIITNLIQFCRDLLLYKNLKESGTSPYTYQKESFVELASEISETKLFYFVDMLVDIQNKIRFTNSPKIYLEVGIIKIVNSATSDINLINQVQKLEEKIELIQPGTINGVNESTTRLDILETRVKKLNSDVEKLDIKEFKEMVLSKLNSFEDVVLSNKNAPLQLEDEIQDLKDAIAELAETKVVSNNNSLVSENTVQINEEVLKQIEELKTNISNINNNDELKNKVQELEIKLSRYLVIEDEESDIDLADIEARVNILTEEFNHIKEISNADVAPVTSTNVDIANVRNLEEKVQVIEEYIDMIISRIDEQSRALKGINNVPVEIEGETHSEIGQLNENYLALLTHIQTLQGKIDAVPTGISEEDINNIENNFNAKLNETVANINNNIQNEITLIEQKIAELSNTDNKELETLIEENKQAIIDVKEYSIKLSGKIKEVQDKLTEMRTKMDGGITKRRSPFEIVREDEPKEETTTKEQVKEEGKTVIKTENTVVIKDAPKPNIESTKVDETSKIYDAKIVERILHQARDQKCREEKISLLSNWSKLEDRVGHLLAPTAKLLSEGTLTANGYNELLIVYPHASMCNHLMEPKGHTNALQILKITFGKDYDFIALPENTWQEKRMEYAGQYNIGIKYPRLSPIKNPELKIVVVNSTNLISKKNQVVHNAKSFFGDDIVESEEE